MIFEQTYLNRAQNSLLQVYDTTTGSIQLIAKFSHVIEAPLFSHNGESLYYNSEGLIYCYSLKTNKITKIDTGNVIYCNNDHVLAPDGSGIAISGNTENTGASKIYAIHFEAKEVKEIVSKPFSYLHGWSPDMKTLSYCAAREIDGKQLWDVYTCPASGGEEKRLTDAPGLNDGPEFSSDGKTIWFQSVRTGLMQIWKMNSDGSNQTQMTFDQDMNSWFPHISPDGKKVVYIAYYKNDLLPGEHLADKNVEIRMIPAEGGKPVTLLKLFGGQGTINVNSWSPDSRKFAFVSYQR